MKLTKKIEAEILNVYDTWLNAYLNGDVKTYNQYLDDEYHFIGSTNNEEFLNRKDTTKFFEDTADQLAGKCDLRNDNVTIEQFGELIFITQIFDAWFQNGTDYSYYGRFRFSSTLRRNNEGWRFIYQHFSTPDSKTDEGETIGFDKISEENIELRDAIKRRTIELEAKNRDLEIEGALGRIRAEAVAMKESADLLDIVVTLRTEFTRLGHEAHYFWHMMWLPEKYEKAMTSGDGTRIGFVMELPRHIHGDIPLLANWEKGDEPLVVYPMNTDAAIAYVDKMVSLGDFKNIDPQAPSHDDIRHINGLTFIMARTTHGEIGYSLPGVVKNPPAEGLELLVRFAGAFDLAHRRFLDLQKSEKQAREVQIELALEKVRSRSMAMHKSEELTDAGALLYKELSKLGVQNLSTAYTLFDETATMGWSYGVNPIDGSIRHKPVGMNHAKNKVMKAIAASWKKQEPLLVLQLNEQETIKHQTFIADECIGFPISKEQLLAISPERLVIHTFNFNQGYLLIVGGELLTVTQQKMISRFAKVFQQTYTRFLDLQKAEAQAREAKIENALEKVRSRTMAMQSSSELPEAANNLFLQVQELGIPAWSAGYCIWDDEKKYAKAHMSSEGVIQKPFDLPIKGVGYDFEKPLEAGETFHVDELGGEMIVKHYEFMRTLPIFGEIIDGVIEAGYSLPTFQIFHIVYFKYGYVMFITYEKVPEAHAVFRRFGKVFEQTYTRFLDLQKSEAQIKEARIEAALEKVRGVALALQKSDDMLDVVQSLYEQLLALGFVKIRNAIIDVHNDEKETFLDYDYSNDMSRTITEMSYYGHRIIEEQVRKTQSSSDAFFELVLEGQELQDLIDLRLKNGEKEDPRLNEIDQLTYNLYSFGDGAIGISNFGVLSDDEKVILKRFRNVFTFAYKRYTDLVHAEEQALEAKIEAALEKVRSRSMAMQSSTELPDAAVVMFQQLKDLGIEPNRLYIGIIKDDKGLIEMWATAEDGNEIGSRVDFDITKNKSVAKIFDSWKKQKKSLNLKMEGKELTAYLKYVNEVLGISVQKSQSQKKRFHSVAFFTRGFIGVAAPEEQPVESTKLLERFAAVFNLTYTRFSDLRISEAHAVQAEKDLLLLQKAKQEAETALIELKATQSQLIQSEKMASLGELTAGIAHEIQNPLNFVNNFSEVSNELIYEMNEEMEKGDFGEAKLIAADIKQNLEKISHHGKRADSIVKGMLQHSRKSVAEKEPTDINALCDEFLRLAYHGIRGKDKSFNATLETDFDESMGKVNVISQDIGRVVLNLISNAFYACAERSRSAVNEKKSAFGKGLAGLDAYKPIVSVSTKKTGNHIEIRVSDNGNGIPANALDKIFQPFFTTKPTGQGTGLGLSLSYDIVKAHGGELTVETKEGEGTTFTISIPR